jgi:hypothetical protein
MQIINLVLDHYNFYCPVTGTQIMGDEFLNIKNTPSLMGHWFDEEIFDPTIQDPLLKDAWQRVKKKFNQLDILQSYDRVYEFLRTYPSDSFVTFAIAENTSSAQAWNRSNFFVIDMNHCYKEGNM